MSNFRFCNKENASFKTMTKAQPGISSHLVRRNEE
jgi:hypothetical protein